MKPLTLPCSFLLIPSRQARRQREAAARSTVYLKNRQRVPSLPLQKFAVACTMLVVHSAHCTDCKSSYRTERPPAMIEVGRRRLADIVRRRRQCSTRAESTTLPPSRLNRGAAIQKSTELSRGLCDNSGPFKGSNFSRLPGGHYVGLGADETKRCVGGLIGKRYKIRQRRSGSGGSAWCKSTP